MINIQPHQLPRLPKLLVAFPTIASRRLAADPSTSALPISLLVRQIWHPRDKFLNRDAEVASTREGRTFVMINGALYKDSLKSHLLDVVAKLRVTSAYISGRKGGMARDIPVAVKRGLDDSDFLNDEWSSVWSRYRLWFGIGLVIKFPSLGFKALTRITLLFYKISHPLPINALPMLHPHINSETKSTKKDK